MLASLFKKRHSDGYDPSADDSHLSGSERDQQQPLVDDSVDTMEANDTSTPPRAMHSFQRSASEPVLSGVLSVHPALSIFRSKNPGNKSLLERRASPSSPSRMFFKRRHSVGAEAAQRPTNFEAQPPTSPSNNDAVAASSPQSSTASGRSTEGRPKRRLRLVDESFDGLLRPSEQTPPASPYGNNSTAMRSSPELSQLVKSPSAEEAFYSFRVAEPLPSGTPSSMHRGGILREGRAPGTGNSVRFFSRDNIRIISPNVSVDSEMFASRAAVPSASHEQSLLTMGSLGPAMHEDESFVDPSLAIDRTSVLGPSLSAPFSAPSTPLTGPASSSFLSRLRDMSPATPEGRSSARAQSTTPLSEPADVTLDMLSTTPDQQHKSIELSKSPSSSSLAFYRSIRQHESSPLSSRVTGPLSVVAHPIDFSSDFPQTSLETSEATATEFRPTPLPERSRSLMMEEAPSDMSNLMGDTPGVHANLSITVSMLLEKPPEELIPTTARITKPRADETIITANTDLGLLDDKVDETGDFTEYHTVLAQESDDEEEKDAEEEKAGYVTGRHTRITEFEQEEEEEATEANKIPVDIQPAVSTSLVLSNVPQTPLRQMRTSTSLGDLTVYLTPRSTLQERMVDLSTPRSPFSADLNCLFSRQLLDKALSPTHGQDSPSLVYAVLPLDGEASAEFQAGRSVAVPSLPPDQLLALNAELQDAWEARLSFVARQLELQAEISRELEGSVQRKDSELRELKRQRSSMGEVRDLEVRLEMERNDTEAAIKERDVERQLREEMEEGLADLRRAIKSLEAERRDQEVAAEGARRSSMSPTAAAEAEGSWPIALESKRIAQLEAGLAQANKTLSEKEDSLAALQKRLENAQQTLEGREEKLHIAKEDNTLIVGRVDELELKVAELEEENRVVVAKLEESQHLLNEDHARYEEERNALATAHRDVLAELQALASVAPTAGPATAVDNELRTLVVTLAASRRDLASLAIENSEKACRLQENIDELNHQWKRAEQTHDEMDRLKVHRDQLADSLRAAEEERDGLEQKVEMLAAERDMVVQEKDAILAGQEELVYERDAYLEDRDQLVVQRDEAWEEKESLLEQLTEKEEEIAAIEERMIQISESSAGAVEQMQTMSAQHAREMEQLVQLRAANADLTNTKDYHVGQARQLKDRLAEANASLETAETALSLLKRRFADLEDSSAEAASRVALELEEARDQGERSIRELQRNMKEQSRMVEELERTRAEERAQFEAAILDRASAEMSAQMSGSRLSADLSELERLGKLVAQLKSDDAAKEVRIIHLLKSRSELREIMEGLEIALDSKQQELELVKRRYGVTGVGGATPSTNRVRNAVPSSISRRQSLATPVFTPGPDSASASVSSNPVSVPETPNAASRLRPRSSLAMGTPGLSHRVSLPSRPRSSLSVTTLPSLQASLPEGFGLSTTTTAPTPNEKQGGATPSMRTTLSSRPRYSTSSLAPPLRPSMETDESPTIVTRSLRSSAIGGASMTSTTSASTTSAMRRSSSAAALASSSATNTRTTIPSTPAGPGRTSSSTASKSAAATPATTRGRRVSMLPTIGGSATPSSSATTAATERKAALVKRLSAAGATPRASLGAKEEMGVQKEEEVDEGEKENVVGRVLA